eukprot:10245756-Lingulodinium_polyedra.AAC.1
MLPRQQTRSPVGANNSSVARGLKEHSSRRRLKMLRLLASRRTWQPWGRCQKQAGSVWLTSEWSWKP